MRRMLDTNVCIRYLNGRSPLVKSRLDACQPGDVVVCSIVKAELAFGAALSLDPSRTKQLQDIFLSRFVSLTFDDNCARVYGDLRAYLQRLGTPIGPNDSLIAAITIANDATLVTHNVEEFSRVPNLLLEDWETVLNEAAVTNNPASHPHSPVQGN